MYIILLFHFLFFSQLHFLLRLQITDFGLSITKTGVGHDNMMQDFCGTPSYMGKKEKSKLMLVFLNLDLL